MKLRGRQLRQAAEAFAEVEKLNVYHGPLNLARVYYNEGELDKAVDAINRALEYTDPLAPPWTVAWLSGLINRQQGHLEAAEANFRKVLEDRTPEMIERGFDFSKDYKVINELGLTLFELAKSREGQARDAYLRRAVEQFEKTLTIDVENLSAHYNLQLLYAQLGDEDKAAEHAALHARYKPDDNARARATAAARLKYPAANHAAEDVVIYPLHRPGAPQLPADAQLTGEPGHNGGGR